MGRNKRQYGTSGIYHVIIRGNNKQNIFLDNNDRMIILDKIYKFSSQLGISILAYCLMNNHVHLLIGNSHKNLSKFMLKLNTSYSHIFNYKYERTGHLFQGRFLSVPIENDLQVKIVFRYILHNTDNANLCSYNTYKWNSYTKNIGEYTNPNIQKGLKISDFFTNKDEIIRFLSIKKEEKNSFCIDYKGKKHINDSHCQTILISEFNIYYAHILQRLNHEKLKRILIKLRNSGASINQLSRISGLSRKQIQLSCG